MYKKRSARAISCRFASSSGCFFDVLVVVAVVAIIYDTSLCSVRNRIFSLQIEKFLLTASETICFWLGKNKMKVPPARTTLVNEPDKYGETINSSLVQVPSLFII